MNAPEQMDALRAHLDDALAGVGSRLPGDAAPSLLRTARRRNRTKRLAATAGSAVVIAALVIGVGSRLNTDAGHQPTDIIPATQPPSAVATSQPSSEASTTATPSAAAAAPTGMPSAAPEAGVQVVKQNAIDSTLVAQPAYSEKIVGGDALYLGPGIEKAGDTTLGQLIRVDLKTGAQTTVVTGLRRPLGGVTEIDGNIFLAENVGGKPEINEYSADGTRTRTLDLPVSKGRDCNPTTSCLSDQVGGTRLIGLGDQLVVTTPSGDTTTAVIAINLATGAADSTVSLQAQNIEALGTVGDTVYLSEQGKLFAVTGQKVVTAALNGGDGSYVTVSPQGLYYSSRSDGGGPRPGVPITLTLRRFDPVSLKLTATISESLAQNVVSTPGLSPTVVNKILYTSIGTCTTPPLTDACVNRRNPTTLELMGTDVLRLPQGATDQAALVTGSDGTAVLESRGYNPNKETIDLLGHAPAG